MKKVKLNLNELKVASFETAQSTLSVGTVKGQIDGSIGGGICDSDDYYGTCSTALAETCDYTRNPIESCHQCYEPTYHPVCYSSIC